MAEIGRLVVDLTLKSAEFINNLNKSSQAVARNSAAMQKSMSGLERSVDRVGKAFEAWLTVRTLRQIERLVVASLNFAATLEGPLGDSTRKFQSQFEELQNHFEAGLAIGFLDQVKQGFFTTEQTIKTVDDVSVALGNTLGFIFQQVSQFALNEVPQLFASVQEFGRQILIAAQGPLPLWLKWVDSLNDGLATAINRAAEFANIAARVPTVAEAQSSLVSPDTSAASDAATTSVAKQADAFQKLADATLKARMESVEFWQATVTTTGLMKDWLAENEADIAFIEKAGTPLEQYRLHIAAIGNTMLDTVDKARLMRQEQVNLISTYLDGIQQATGALAAGFRENKAIQIANAVVNTAAGVVKALGDPKLPYPLDWAVAASIAAAGAAQIATIVSAQPGSGTHGGKSSKAMKTPKGGGSIASAGAASTAAAPAAAPATGGGFTQAVTIEILGDVFGPEHFRKIVEGINNVQRDGTAILRIA